MESGGQRPTSAEHYDLWTALVDKVLASSILVMVTKLVSAWSVASLWELPVRSRWAWRIVPYAGLATDTGEFRRVSTASTVIVMAVAIVWVSGHMAARHRHRPPFLVGACAAPPMVAFMSAMEWWRRVDTEHLLGGAWLVQVLCVLAATTVIVAGFVRRTDFVDRAHEALSRSPDLASP